MRSHKWIKTEAISVPAHANTTTEVNINEWFQANRSFLLGTPVASQLRGTAGGWVQTCAIAPHPGQDTVALLRDRLSQLLKMAKGDEATSPQVGTNHLPAQEDTNMATVIPVDKFESNSFYSFILRENPKAQGIEIHFPPDCTNSEVLERRWTNGEKNGLRDRINAGTNGFVSLIEKEGFEQAHKNPFLWYVKETEPSSFNQKITKARSWVNKCSNRGAYEIDASIPVESTKSRRRTSKPAVQTSCEPHTPPTQPAQGSKLADAIAAVLLPQIVEAVSSGVSAEELERLKSENNRYEQIVRGMTGNLEEADKKNRDQAAQIEQLKEELYQLQQMRTQWEVENNALATERDAAHIKIQEMEQAMSTLGEEVEKFRGMAVELESERDSLKLTLAELGVDEVFTPPAQDVDWGNTDAAQSEPEAMSWDEDEPSPEPHTSYTASTQDVSWDEDESLGESPSDSRLSSGPDDTEESEESDDEGFDLDSLGEL